jgi:hypothetical protein
MKHSVEKVAVVAAVFGVFSHILTLSQHPRRRHRRPFLVAATTLSAFAFGVEAGLGSALVWQTLEEP